MLKNTTPSLSDFSNIFKALSDPHRLRAMVALRNGELCVCQLIDLLSLAPSTVSKHMSILKQAGLVDSRKDSRWVYYRIADETKKKTEFGTIINLTITNLLQDEEILHDDITMSTRATKSTIHCANVNE